MPGQLIALGLTWPPRDGGIARAPDEELEARVSAARDRAITWLLAQRLEERRAADGRCVGIQATLATGPDGENPIELYGVLDGFLEEVEPDSPQALWAEIAELVREKLGFPFEPELFSNMVFAAQLGDSDRPELRRLAQTLLKTFRSTDASGLYHFFTSLRFACDTDCTGMAARARLLCHDIDPRQLEGIRELRRMCHAILRSAAIVDIPAEENRTHGKDNGALRRHVLKVYLDDHEVQGRVTDRGLKHNPVVVANALFPLLYELRLGLRSADEPIGLREYTEDSAIPRDGEATVAEILAASVCYATGYLMTGDWRGGCRYYPSPDAFLWSYSELLHEFPDLFAAFGAREVVREAIIERRGASDPSPYSPDRPLNLALRAIAARNCEMDPSPELARLLELQAEDGAWPGFDCFYTLGTTSSQLPVHFGSRVMTASLCIRAFSPLPTRESQTRDLHWARRVIDEVLRFGQ